MSLLSLPNEILCLIAEILTRKDLISLHRANRRLAQILTPNVYEIALAYKIPEPKPRWGYGPVSVLHWAVVTKNELVLRRLFEKGANVEERDPGIEFEYCSLLHVCEDARIFKLLLQKGANIRVISEIRFYTPLHTAASRGHRKIVATLLEAGIEVDILARDNTTALHLAAESGKIGVARLLLSNGAKIMAKDIRGFTALHYAAARGEYGMSQMLLSRGADAADRNIWGQTAYDMVTTYNNVELKRLLKPDRDRRWRDPLF